MQDDSAVNPLRYDVASDLLRQGMSIEDVSRQTGISRRIIAVLDHSLAVKEGDTIRLERLEELTVRGPETEENFEIKDSNAKLMCKWLYQAGMLPGQVHICTGLSIHKCRHLYRAIREYARKHNCEPVSAMVPMPLTLSARLVMSIFGVHYKFLQKHVDTNSVNPAHVVVAWTRTIEEVINNRFDLLADFEDRLLSLGSLFEVARGFREVPTRMEEMPNPAGGRRVRKLARSTCTVCGCEYVWFLNARRVQATKCCFCELEELADSKMHVPSGPVQRVLPEPEDDADDFCDEDDADEDDDFNDRD